MPCRQCGWLLRFVPQAGPRPPRVTRISRSPLQRAPLGLPRPPRLPPGPFRAPPTNPRRHRVASLPSAHAPTHMPPSQHRWICRPSTANLLASHALCPCYVQGHISGRQTQTSRHSWAALGAGLPSLTARKHVLFSNHAHACALLFHSQRREPEPPAFSHDHIHTLHAILMVLIVATSAPLLEKIAPTPLEGTTPGSRLSLESVCLASSAPPPCGSLPPSLT